MPIWSSSAATMGNGCKSSKLSSVSCCVWRCSCVIGLHFKRNVLYYRKSVLNARKYFIHGRSKHSLLLRSEEPNNKLQAHSSHSLPCPALFVHRLLAIFAPFISELFFPVSWFRDNCHNNKYIPLLFIIYAWSQITLSYDMNWIFNVNNFYFSTRL